MILGMPYGGRAIPCGLITYSSKTVTQQADSRNQNHFRVFAALKDMLGERPLMLDREFSYLELMLNLAEELINRVIRLNLLVNPPKFSDGEGQEVALTISPGETVIHNDVWYMGKVQVNLIGTWKKGLTEPMWVMTSLPAREGLRIYFARRKIEETFRDLKSLLGMTKLMNKHQTYRKRFWRCCCSLLPSVYWSAKKFAISCMANPFQETSKSPKRSGSLAHLLSKKAKSGNAIPACLSCSSRNALSLPNSNLPF